MKIAKMSLAAALALGLFGNIGFAADAQTLEEAIKGTSFDGFLRYRLNSDSYENKGGALNNNDTTTTHQYRAYANLRTAPINDLAVNVGVLYINEAATTGTGTVGTGLGAGSDGAFGVSTYYAIYAPKHSTTTTVTAGKQILDTPLTDSGDFDRGTGIVVTNKDVVGLTLVGAVYDTWSLSNMYAYGDSSSVMKGLFNIGAIYEVPNMLTAQLWYFNAVDVADTILFADVAYNQDLGGFAARASVSYGMSTLNTATNAPAFGEASLAGQESNNDLLKLNVGATFGSFVVDAGYLMNTQAGYSISLDDQGKIIDPVTMGQTWWQDSGTKTSIGIGRRLNGNGGTANAVAAGGDDSLSVLYGSVGAKNIANTGIGVHLTYVMGSSEYTLNNVAQLKRDFQEIVPLVNYQYNQKLSFQTFYSMLSADINTDGATVTESRNRYRLQALYKF